MDVKRARDIMNSTSDINVLYNNERIWIESVNNHNATAVVRFLGTQHSETVALGDLTEGMGQ